jgi:hypothetical protein
MEQAWGSAGRILGAPRGGRRCSLGLVQSSFTARQAHGPPQPCHQSLVGKCAVKLVLQGFLLSLMLQTFFMSATNPRHWCYKGQ